MKKTFIQCRTFIGKGWRERHSLILTRNEFRRGKRRFSNHVESVRRKDIKQKRAMTIDNGRSFV